MTTLQEAARKALACLELYDHEDLASCEARHELRTALAQQGEPVAWAIYDKRGGSKSIHWAEQHTDGNAEMYNAVPLYTAAPAPQPVHQGERAELIRRLYAIANTEANEVADVLNEAADMLQSAQPAQEPVEFFANGTRFKISKFAGGVCITGMPDELAGRWAALVAAEDNCHLQSAQPKQEPLTDKRISWLWSESHNDTTDRMAFQVFARAIEAAHGITGHVPKTNFGDIKQPRELTDEHIAAANMCRKAGRVSVSMVQRKMNTGYQEAQVLVAEIVAAGLVDGIEASGLPNI